MPPHSASPRAAPSAIINGSSGTNNGTLTANNVNFSGSTPLNNVTIGSLTWADRNARESLWVMRRSAFNSCFISYSAKDEDIVRRLHADLQDNGVRCWFAPEDMKIRAKILDTLDQPIRLRDKILLVLSETAIASNWVEDEVNKGFAEESQRGGLVLFPVRIDDAVLSTSEAWATKLRDVSLRRSSEANPKVAQREAAT